MTELSSITFRESSYGCFDEMQDVIQNWTKANKDTAKIKRGEHGVLQEIVDGKLKNSRTVTLWCEGNVSDVTNPADCSHGSIEETVVEATCTTDGSITKICKSCYKTISRERIKALGHTLKTEQVDGMEETSCETCGRIIRRIPDPNFTEEEEET